MSIFSLSEELLQLSVKKKEKFSSKNQCIHLPFAFLMLLMRGSDVKSSQLTVLLLRCPFEIFRVILWGYSLKCLLCASFKISENCTIGKHALLIINVPWINDLIFLYNCIPLIYIQICMQVHLIHISCIFPNQLYLLQYDFKAMLGQIFKKPPTRITVIDTEKVSLLKKYYKKSADHICLIRLSKIEIIQSFPCNYLYANQLLVANILSRKFYCFKTICLAYK